MEARRHSRRRSLPNRITPMQYEIFAMNLLRTLDALFVEKSVTRAAEWLCIGQPAMSGAPVDAARVGTHERACGFGQNVAPATHHGAQRFDRVLPVRVREARLG